MKSQRFRRPKIVKGSNSIGLPGSAIRSRITSLPFWLLLALLIALPAVSWAISLDDVIELSQAGYSDEQITHLIKVTQSRFQVDTDAIIDLKEAGVSDTVILAVIRVSQTGSPTSSRPAEPGESGTIDSSEGDDTDIESANTLPHTEWAEQGGYFRHEITIGFGGGDHI